MSRTYISAWSAPLDVIINIPNMCKFSITWELYAKIELAHQILCIKIKIPTSEEKILHAETLSSAKFGTFSSLLSVQKYFDFKSHILVWETNRQNHQIMKKTLCHLKICKHHKIHTIWLFSYWKKCLKAKILICGYKPSLNHEKHWIPGKILIL